MFPLKDNLPTTRPPLLTLALIVANVLAYFVWQQGGILHGPSDVHVVDWGWIPWEIQNDGQCAAQGRSIACGEGVTGQPGLVATALTSMFMHGSILHLGGNMLFLWIFGNNIEDALGPIRFLLFYVAAGIAAIALQTVLTDGDGAMVPMVGASGAVAGVLGAYVRLYPRARVLTLVVIIFFVTMIEVPALAMLGLWFVTQVAFAATSLNEAVGSSGGVAYFAHVGGFALGLLTIVLLRPRHNPAYERIARGR